MNAARWSAESIAKHTDAARIYLARELGPRVPPLLRFVAAFDESPLEDEGPVAIFSFELAPSGSGCAAASGAAPHFVVMGETEPNYFPAYGLDADGMYDLHIGTRFALGTGLERIDPQREPARARDGLRHFVAVCNPGVEIEEESLAALFAAGDQIFAVYRLRLRGQAVYCLGADCPPGFYTQVEHPPQVVLRLHLGRLIRNEARDEAEHAAARRLSQERHGRYHAT